MEAESEAEAFEKAEEAYCDYDENDWEEFEENDGAECISVNDLEDDRNEMTWDYGKHFK